MASAEEHSKVLELSGGDGYIKFNTRNFRAHPIACARVMDAIKMSFQGQKYLPTEGSYISDQKLKVIRDAYSQPLRDGEKERRKSMQLKSVLNLLMSIQGMRVDRLKPWTLSPMFTIAYYLRKNREKDSAWSRAHQRMLHEEGEVSLKDVKIVLGVIGDEFTNKEICNICKLLQKPAKQEMMVLLNEENRRLDECSKEDEESMNFFFKYQESEQFIPVEIEENFLIFENKEIQLIRFPAKCLQSDVDDDEIVSENPSYKHEKDERKILESDKKNEKKDVESNKSEKTAVKNEMSEDKVTEIKDHKETDEMRESDEMDATDATEFEMESRVEDATQSKDESERQIETNNDEQTDDYNEENKEMSHAEVDTVNEDDKQLPTSNNDNLDDNAESLTKKRRFDDMLEPLVVSASKSLHKFVNNERHSDVKFVFSNSQCIHGHAIILEHKSDAFAEMFSNDISVQSPGVVNIKSITYEVMLEAMRYIYTGKVQNLDKFAGQLLEPANRFMLEDLTALCEEHVSKKLSVKNVVSWFIVADRYNLVKLKERAKEIIAENMKQVVDLPEFENVVHKNPKLALEIMRCIPA